jgi:hypothetical protein
MMAGHRPLGKRPPCMIFLLHKIHDDVSCI